MRREVYRDGVKVSVIQPGAVKTPIWKKAEDLDISRYVGTKMERRLSKLRDDSVRRGQTQGVEPSAVAQKVGHALTARRPKNRYLVMRGAFIFKILTSLPDFIKDRMLGTSSRN